MKNLSLTLIILLYGSFNILCAQQIDSTNSIESEILKQDVDIILLSKSRAALIESLQKKDLEKAAKILDYMKEKFDTSKVKIFFRVEELLTSYWLSDYDVIFSIAASNKMAGGSGDKLVPQQDLYLKNLKTLSQNETDLLKNNIKSANLPPYKRDFLYLLLKDILERKDYYEENDAFQEEMNKLSDEYFSLYKDSEFIPFIRQYLRYVLVESPWGFGIETSIGSLTIPDNFSSYIKNFVLVSIAFDGAYKKIYGGLRLDLGAAHKIRKGFIYNGTWNEGLTIMHTGVAFTGGYMFSLGNNFTFTPQAGIAYMDFSPPEQEKNKEGNDVAVSFNAWALGFNMDIPLSGKNGSTYLRVYAGHRIAMTDFDLAKGGYTFITLGVDLFGRPKFREL